MVKGIYGNEIGVILGVNKNKSIKEFCLEKFDKLSKNKDELNKEKEEIYWSDTIKENICKEFTIRSGKKVRKELKIVIDEEYEFMHSKVDRRIAGENSILICIIYNGNGDKGEVDDNVFFQCQHDMRVTKTEKCYVAFLINNKRFEIKQVLRNDKVIQKIINEEKKFHSEVYLKEYNKLEIK